MGSNKRSPADILGTLALAAAEQGDEEIRVAALATAAQRLERADNKNKASIAAHPQRPTSKLATATWTRMNHWRNLILTGPDGAALKGPILADCVYPDVLVARAVSDGEGPGLVLYNGHSPGPQRLTIERLLPSNPVSIGSALAAEVRSASGRQPDT
jgi:hypothetical protein